MMILRLALILKHKVRFYAIEKNRPIVAAISIISNVSIKTSTIINVKLRRYCSEIDSSLVSL